MEMKFHGLEFKLDGEKIYLTNLMNFAYQKEGDSNALFKFVECQIAGEDHAAHCGAKQLNCSETNRLVYSSYAVRDQKLEIINKSPLNFTIVSSFQAFDDCKVIRTWNSVYNDSSIDYIIENLSSLRFAGFGENGTDSCKDLDVYVFHNSWHVECQVSKHNLQEDCYYNGNSHSMKRFLISNTGSWSTKEYLPQCIIEDKKNQKFLFLQIESSSSWSFEIGDENKHFYLNAGGPNTTDHNAAFKLSAAPSDGFTTKAVAFVVGDSINEVIQEMTKYRRHIVKQNHNNEDLPVIYNEYMHLSWEGPTQERTEAVAEKLVDFGIKYYVIDCGWHDEVDLNSIYKECGAWIESDLKFPKGVKKTSSKLKSLGMKTGLWIEPEIIGTNSKKMYEYYGDDAFFKRNGKKIVMASRMFLDFRHPKVISYLNTTIERMINQYGASYLKLDYNQDSGAGTETDAVTVGEGLVKSTDAYKRWIESLTDKYPNVIFETCSSGGCRMDYETLQSFSLVSTSDQTNFAKYPYIASNILSAVIPEQAGVWSYPVDCISAANFKTIEDMTSPELKQLVNSKISKEQVAINMVNTFLGRMHLASAIFLLDDDKQAIIKEGVHYYNAIVNAKKKGVPYFPFGFSHFGDQHVSSGFISDNVLYLAVWNLKGDQHFSLPIRDYTITNVTKKFPTYSKPSIIFNSKEISIVFEHNLDCCFLEIGLRKHVQTKNII